jgi:hypothetical protein
MPRAGPPSGSVALGGSPRAPELAAALEQASLALDAGCEVLCCHVERLEADLWALDALARVSVLARRSGCEVRLLGPSGPLLELIALAGLQEALGAPSPRSAAAARRGGRSSRSSGRT